MEIKPRINFEGRTRLETVIPLSTPYLVFLDPSDKCNAKCKWCPTGSGEARKYKKPMLMDFDLYKKIIRDLEDMPEPIKTLRLYSDGEPLMNPNLPKMVRVAKDTGRFGQVDTTTNGILLTPKLGKKLVDAGLDKIFISVPPDYTEAYKDQINNFIAHKGSCQVYVKTIGDEMWDMEKEMFYVDFADADRVFIENMVPCWPNFDSGPDHAVGIYNQKLAPEPMVCSYIFYSVKINSDGTVSLCFLDWSHTVLVGDLKRDSFKNIWQGNLLREVRRVHLAGKRKTEEVYPFNLARYFCGTCGQLKYGAPDNIDAYAEELLRKI